VSVPLRLWHLTSLDAPTVAVVWTLAFARAAAIQLPLWVPAVLAFGAWAVYIGDRLLDARAATTPLRPRHWFHWQHRCIFLPLAAASLLLALTFIGSAILHHQMPPATRERNSLLAAAALAYFTTVHTPWHPATRRLRLPKELLVGILFTLACALPALARAANPMALLPAVPIYIALAWLNCHAIETWESRPVASIQPAALTLIAAAALSTLVTLHQPGTSALLLAATLSGVLLVLLDRFRTRLHPTTLRALADLVLLTPAAFLLINH